MEKLERPRNYPPQTLDELCDLLTWANATAEEAIRRARVSEREIRAVLRSIREPTAHP
jgi:hypothetical protein